MPLGRPPRPTACRKCGEKSLRKDWGLAKSGRPRVMCPKCVQAIAARRAMIYNWPAGPCQGCGKAFVVRYQSQVKVRKYCSYTCSDRHSALPRGCRRCSLVKPADQFARRRSHRRSQVCIACEHIGARRPVVGNSKSSRLLPEFMVANLRQMAHRQGKAFKVKRFQVRSLYKKPCSLCGAPMTTARLIDKAGDYDAANLRPLCAYCVKLLSGRQFSDMLLMAHAIAAHCPLEGSKHAKSDAR